MDEVGREINMIARDFNSGYGTTERLHQAVRRLGDVYERLYSLRMKGYLYAAQKNEDSAPWTDER